MKKSLYLIFCLVAMGCFCSAMCSDENENGNNDNSNHYTNEMIVGTWQVDNVTVNGEPMNPEELIIIMNEGGTGLISDHGVTENNEFTWSLNGDQLTINERHGEHQYTINSLSDNEATFTGTTIPGMEGTQGEVVVHITRIR